LSATYSAMRQFVMAGGVGGAKETIAGRRQRALV
jgi:hypothetical protein